MSTRALRKPQADLSSGRRTRLQTLYTVAAATLAAIVPLVIFAGFWIRSEIHKGQAETEAYLAVQARAISYRLDGEVREQLSALSTLAALPSLDAQSFDDFTRDSSRVLTARPAWTTLGLIDPSTGSHVFAQGGAWPAMEETSVVARVRESRRPMVVARPVSVGREDVLLYAPVIRPDPVSRADTVRWIIASEVKIRVLDDVAGQVPGSGTLASVMDDDGRVLSRSREAGRFVGLPETETFRTAATKPEGLFEGTSLDGDEVASAYARSPLTGWVAAVSMNRKQLDAASRNSIVATIAAGMLGVILIAILGIFLFHTIMEKRVSNERLAAARALGDLDARLLATTQEALDGQRKAASEREVLLREIYHRVKNNLQIVQSLLRLGSRDLKPDQREPFESAVRRIGAMARVHTLLYNSPDLASIDFKDYLDELLRELSEGFSAEERSIEHVLEANSLRLPLDTAVPLAFIAVEILTNAFRHAFPEGRAGRISVSADHVDGTGRLKIEDNGIGLTSEQRSKRRLGLTIVGKLVQQIGGAIVEPEPGSSTFVITFPIDKDEGGSPSGDRPGGKAGGGQDVAAEVAV